MKDSQLDLTLSQERIKYIKADNERFSTLTHEGVNLH